MSKIPNRKFVAPLGSASGSASPQRWSLSTNRNVANGVDTLTGSKIWSDAQFDLLTKIRRRQFPRRKHRRTIQGEEYALVMVTDPKLAMATLYPSMTDGRARFRSIQKRREITKQSAEHLRKQNYNARVIHWKNQSGIYIKVGKKKPPTMTQLLVGRDKSNYPSYKRGSKSVHYSNPNPSPTYRKANLVERPVTFNYTIKDKGSKTKAYSSKRTRPQMVVIGENQIPMDLANDYSSSYKPLEVAQLKADTMSDEEVIHQYLDDDGVPYGFLTDAPNPLEELPWPNQLLDDYDYQDIAEALNDPDWYIGDGKFDSNVVQAVRNQLVNRLGTVLDTEQRRGIDLMVSSLLDRPESDLGTTDGGFLLADGTGFGKTRQLLAVADQWWKHHGQPLSKRPSPMTKRTEKEFKELQDRRRVLIITENQETIADSFTNDAKALGIDLDRFDITTYSELGGPSHRGEELLNKKYGLVIYDEAHNMKNNLTPRAEKAISINTEKAVFATATPLDTAPGGAYFLSRVTGIDEQEIQDSLGLYLDVGAGGHEYWASTLSTDEINDRLAQYRQQLISNGLMMRRIHPFYGDVISSAVEMDQSMKNEMAHIDKYWRLNKTVNSAGQRALELGRWEEAHKVPLIYKNLRESLAEGKQVVVAIATSGDQAFKGLDDPYGTIAESGPRRIERGLKGAEKRIKALNKEAGKETGLLPIKTTTVRKKWVKYEDSALDGLETTVEENWHVGRKGAAHLLKEMLEEDGIEYSELTQHQKGAKEVAKFQDGKTKVMIMTPQSGGTGINLDDRQGTSPRHLIIGTKGWAGDKLEQLLGRVSRKTTKSPSLGEFIGLKGGWADIRQTEVLKTKLSALRSMTGSDIYGFESYEKEWKPTITRRKESREMAPERIVAAA